MNEHQVKSLAWSIKKKHFPALKINQVYEGMSRAFGFQCWHEAGQKLICAEICTDTVTKLLVILMDENAGIRFAEATGTDVAESNFMVQQTLLPELRTWMSC